MPRRSATGISPVWDRLYEIAVAQAGHLSVSQARDAGYSAQLLQHYVRTGKLERVRRGILRLVHFPAGEHEDLVADWLWSERIGVFSHETALMLHQLSDALPAKRHMTVPRSWKKRRLQLPVGLVLHLEDMPKRDTMWVAAVPVTNPLRTVVDCTISHVDAAIVKQAIEEGTGRGLFKRNDVRKALRQRVEKHAVDVRHT